ncbi:MAG: ATP synthase F1 subunit gamma [Holdemania massiliensis]
MAQGKQALKGRIRSVSATRKITSAMELIANAKLQKQRVQMEKNREYADTLRQMVSQILANNPDSDCVYLKKNQSSRTLTFMFTSDMGLCGAYNANLLRMAQEILDPQDPMIVIGTKGTSTLRQKGFNLIHEPIGSDHVDFYVFNDLADEALNLYVDGEIGKIQILYCQFVNAVTFTPQLLTLLPVSPMEREGREFKVETLFEPGPDEILKSLIPMYVRSLLYSTHIRQNGGTRFAPGCDGKCDGQCRRAIDKLTLQYNQARQAAITQEITEIVAGADAS